MGGYYEETKQRKKGLSREEEHMLEEIKLKVPIQDILIKEILPTNPDYWTDGMSSLDNTYTCLCPLHQEDTPSMRIFPSTNTCNCYAGCGGGDGIWLYREYQNKVMNHSIRFKDAIRYLYGKYVEGKNLSTVAFTDLMKVENQNTPQEVYEFYRVITENEAQLSYLYRDKVDTQALLVYAQRVDTVRRLVTVQEMRATTGKQELITAYETLKQSLHK